MLSSKSESFPSLAAARRLQMALERPPRPIRLAVRIDVQHDPRHLAPVGTFRVRIIKQAHVGDGVLLVVGGERGIGRHDALPNRLLCQGADLVR